MSRWVALMLLLVSLASAAEAPTFVPVCIRTSPPGASLYLDVSGAHPPGPYLGRSGDDFWLDLRQARRISALRILCRLEGYHDRVLEIPSGFFETEAVWPRTGPVQLAPATWQAWFRERAPGGLLVGGLAIWLTLWFLRRLQRRQRMVLRESFLATWRREDDPLALAVVGNWRLLERLGEGAHGVVYRAMPENELPGGRPVAVKLYRPDHHQQGRHEVLLASRLLHPGLVPVLDYGIAQGRLFVVFDLVEGASPSDLPYDLACACVLQLMEIVDYVHDQGVVHGDIRPQNVLLEGLGRPRLIDFGRGMPSSAAPAYVAPELLQGGRRATRASDQYSLGVVAWELVTGAHPFQAEDVVSLLRRRQEPLPKIPGRSALSQVLSRMLATHPNDRYPGIRDAATAWRKAVERP